MESSDQVLNDLSNELTLTLTAEDKNYINEASYEIENNISASEKDGGNRNINDLLVDKDDSLENKNYLFEKVDVTLENQNYSFERTNELNKLEADCEEFSKDNIENSIYVRIQGLKKPGVSVNYFASWYKFFKETVGINVPLIQPPGEDSQIIFFKFKSIEDRNILLAYCQRGGKFVEEKLIAKPIMFKVNRPDLWKGIGLLQLEEALDLLYPYKNKLYTEQLSEKYNRQKKLITSKLFPAKLVEKYAKVKKPLKSIRSMKYIASCMPTDGYENNVLIVIEKNAETGDVVYGLRVLNKDKNSTAIVPLEHCLSVPRQIVLVCKRIIPSLLDSGLEAFCPATGKGDLLGIILRLTKVNSLILTAFVKVVDSPDFYEFSSDGMICYEDKKSNISLKEMQLKVLVESQKRDFTEKLNNFFDINGKNLGISAVFSLPLYCQYSLLMTSRILQKIMKKPSFIAGDRELIHKLNGVFVPISWDREIHPEIYDNAILFFEPTFIHSKTHVFLLSPIKEIGYYFAKKCKIVTQIETCQGDLAGHSKPPEASNLLYWYCNAKLQMPNNYPLINTIIIWWPLVNSNSKRINEDLKILKQLLEFKIPNLACLTFWSPSNKNLTLYQELFETIYSRLRINKVSLFDYEPYRMGCGMFTLFRGRHDEIQIPPQNTPAGHLKEHSQQVESQQINTVVANKTALNPTNKFKKENISTNKNDLNEVSEMRKQSSSHLVSSPKRQKSYFPPRRSPCLPSRRISELAPSPSRKFSRKEGHKKRSPDRQRIRRREYSYSPDRADSCKRQRLHVSPPIDTTHRDSRRFSPKPKCSRTPERYMSYQRSSARRGSPYSPPRDVYRTELPRHHKRTPECHMERYKGSTNSPDRRGSSYSPLREDHHKQWPGHRERTPEHYMSGYERSRYSPQGSLMRGNTGLPPSHIDQPNFNMQTTMFHGPQNPDPSNSSNSLAMKENTELCTSYIEWSKYNNKMPAAGLHGHQLPGPSYSFGGNDSFARNSSSPAPLPPGFLSNTSQESGSSKSLAQVVQNLQNMAKEMETLINLSKEQFSAPEPPFNWPQKRSCPDSRESTEWNSWQGRNIQDQGYKELYKIEDYDSLAYKRRKDDKLKRYSKIWERKTRVQQEPKFHSQELSHVTPGRGDGSASEEKSRIYSERDLDYWHTMSSSNDYYTHE